MKCTRGRISYNAHIERKGKNGQPKTTNLEVNLLHIETGFREHGKFFSEESIGRFARTNN